MSVRRVEKSTVHFIGAIKTNIIPRRKKSEGNAIDRASIGGCRQARVFGGRGAPGCFLDGVAFCGRQGI